MPRRQRQLRSAPTTWGASTAGARSSRGDLQRAPPRLVIAVPLHRRREPVVEAGPWLVAELRPDLRVVERVTPVVALAVLDVVDVGRPVPTACVEQPLGEIPIGQLDATADVVDLA